MRALYVSHTGMTEPLGQSQVLPYVRGLAAAGWDIEVLSFEPPGSSDEDIERVGANLRSGGISHRWLRRNPSHSFSVKAAEFARAAMRLWMSALARRPKIIHARSYLPGAIAEAVTTATPGARFIFDLRGLLGEEYVDAGHWSKTSYKFRLLKAMERRMLARAGGVVVLTERHRKFLVDETRLLPVHTPLEVIPCCVDEDKFVVSEDERQRQRTVLNAEDAFVLGYAGTLRANYKDEDIVRLFAAVRRRRRARLLVLSHSPTDRLWASVDREGIPRSEVHAQRVAPADMPRVLSAADAGVCFMSPLPSRIGTSPTKVPEYLALGLPVVMNRGIGDSDQLMNELPFVIDAGALSAEDIERAAESLLALPAAAVRQQAREAAHQRFSLREVGVPRYVRLYERVRRM